MYEIYIQTITYHIDYLNNILYLTYKILIMILYSLNYEDY